MDVEASDLLIFARVVEVGSLTRAAARLGLPKSSLSRRLTVLEEALGERLLIRSTRRLTLTEFGESLLGHARRVAEETAEAAVLAQHRQAAPSGRLRVSMPSDFASLVLAPLLTEFSARHPAVVLDLDLSPHRVDLVAGNYDLALRMGDLPDDSTLAARRIAVFTAGLYASPAYTARRGLPEGPGDLAGHDTLGLAGAEGPLPWTLRRGKDGWQQIPAVRTVANSPELLVRLACLGAGIAAVPDQYAAPYVVRRELVRILPEWCLPAVPCWAVFPGRRLMPAKTRAFLDQLTAAFAV